MSVGGTSAQRARKVATVPVIPLTVPTEGLWWAAAASFVAYPGVYPVECDHGRRGNQCSSIPRWGRRSPSMGA